jgi:Ala-tRNA(Pro) deacylase
MYERLLSLLDSRGAEYRLIHHVPALPDRWRARVVTCTVVRTSGGLVLAVVPGGARVSFGVPVPARRAAMLTGYHTLVPFSFRADLPVVVDRNLLSEQEILFSARRDVTVGVATADYVRLAAPRIADIAPSTKAA